MLKKVIKLGLSAIILMLACQGGAWAYTGWCNPAYGTQVFTVPFTYNLNDPSQNVAGRVISPANTWDLGVYYTGSCDCVGSGVNHYKAESPLTDVAYRDGTRTYYSVNDYLAVATDVFIGGNVLAYRAAPFTDVGNNKDSPCGVQKNFETGSKGNIHLYFKKPFVGESVIPSTTVIRVYGTKTPGSYSGTPLSIVNISGTVTVPQSCKINDGQVINIEFGNILSNDFKTKGAGPTGYAAKVEQLAYVCTNMAQGVKLNFTFKGQASPDDSNALATSNPDVGVRLEDMSGTVLTPNSGKLPAVLDHATQKGSTSFKSYPVNTTGKEPAAGEFKSTATIITNIE
ncbi:fimbrial protein [Serratia proteamaculans]|uniref:fimbrial protein n=1 Tax=Serratia proteamaculans TaxID=28151 RepID=UPI002178B665|nr:fimbrial protein [Serratia proteamaculans]CAI1038946.1 long polar fimbrial protein LpfD [Serratia proteamaculans]CAI1049007.1 long polar fimbrial protein LpfD [Serratia proteamaculans]